MMLEWQSCLLVSMPIIHVGASSSSMRPGMSGSDFPQGPPGCDRVTIDTDVCLARRLCLQRAAAQASANSGRAREPTAGLKHAIWFPLVQSGFVVYSTLTRRVL